jgi:hypothetical protein
MRFEMNEATQIRRLQIEHERFIALTRVSSIFTFRAEGNPPTRYRLLFRGRGLVCTRRVDDAPVDFADEHAVELRLSSGFPIVPPELHWLTPILHPNIAASGHASMRDLGMAWHEQMPLDAVCEHVWDVIRLQVYDLERTVDFWAKKWIKTQRLVELPVDKRPLRDLWRGGINVIPYERKRTAFQEQRSIPEDILYLGEETPDSPAAAPFNVSAPQPGPLQPVPPPFVTTRASERPQWLMPPRALDRNRAAGEGVSDKRALSDNAVSDSEVLYIGEIESPPAPVRDSSVGGNRSSPT